MRGCGAIPASHKIPRLCKAGLGEVDSSSFTSLRTQEPQPTLNRKIGGIITFRVAGFRPGGRACCLAYPEGRNYHLMCLEERNICVEAKGPNNGRALRDAPCKWMPRSASSD